MAEIRHLENGHDVIFFCWGWSDFDKMSQTGAEWHVDCDDMVKLETKCIIPIRRTFGRIPWHVIPEPPATLQDAATWWIQCYDPRATCHIAGCCHLVNSLSWFQSHMPHCRVQSPGEINVMTHDRATSQGVIIPSAVLKIVFRQILFYFCFLMQFWLWRAAAFVSYPIHLLFDETRWLSKI